MLQMLGFAPFGRNENKKIQELASLYGLTCCEHTAKGGKYFMVVRVA